MAARNDIVFSLLVGAAKSSPDVIRERAGDVVHVLDRYQIMARMNKAIDEIRAGARRLKVDVYEPVLKHSWWCLRKRPANLTSKQTVKLRELLKYKLACDSRIPSL